MQDRFAVARALREIGLLLDIKGDNRFRARAYERGARAVEELRDDLAALVASHALTSVAGIGPALASVIEELVTRGQSAQLERLRGELPKGVLELSEIPGLSLKKIQQLSASLGIDSVAALKRACEQAQVEGVPGFGNKTQQKLLDAIERWERREERVLLSSALAEAEALLSHLTQSPAVRRAEIVGSLRRWQESVRDIDILVESDDARAVFAQLSAYPKVIRTVSEEATAATVRLSSGVYVDLHVADAAGFASELLRLTGSAAHVAQLGALAQTEKRPAVTEPARDEAAIYARLGLPYIAPELREARGELTAAQQGRLPSPLIERSDLRGMIHCHTVFSDGKNTVEEMARAAEALGMEYITITDHSPSAHYAGGVTLDRLKRQWDEIARVQETVRVRILRGTESDILADGALDYPDAILEQLDVIIASIHARFKMDEDAMTQRLVRAMRLPFFKIWGHGLGRLVLSRDPVACRVEEVLDAVAQSRAAIEINGDPHRLDLAPEWVQEARKRGIRFVISTDAHSTDGMANLRFGVHAARRGWVQRDEVLNTLDTESFLRAVNPRGRPNC